MQTTEDGGSSSSSSAGKPDLHLSPDQMEAPPQQPPAAAHHPHRGMPTRRASSPNASSAPITQAEGDYTRGIVNQHPNLDESAAPTSAAPSSTQADELTFRVGVSEDRNKKCRRTMEDSHAFVYDFAGVKGQGYFAVFDGHAGKHAAEWCGANFHKYLLSELKSSQDKQPIPDLLNATFHQVDGELSKLAAQGGTHSGCTAVTAFLRLEDENGNAVHLRGDPDSKIGSDVGRGGAGSGSKGEQGEVAGEGLSQLEEDEKKRWIGDGTHRERLKSLFSGGSSSHKSGATTTKETAEGAQQDAADVDEHGNDLSRAEPAWPANLAKRTLYTANVGDARAVLCRGSKAVRLTYDHKGSDAQEAKRITDAGGFVMNNRVNGVLAVTRSLGDSSMKEFVVGSPYTTETTLGKEDKFLIIACDGLWDVCEDQTAVDLIRDLEDPQEASRVLLDHALQNFSTDNLSVLVVALQAGSSA